MSAYAAKGKGLTRTDRVGARAAVQRADYEPCTDVINVINLCSAVYQRGGLSAGT